MPISLALLCVLVFVGVVTAVALVVRSRSGRARSVGDAGGHGDVSELGLRTGARATFVMFRTEFCSRCPQVRRRLDQLTADHDDLAVTEIDLTHRRDLATRFHILQTPTTLVVDDRGTVRARIGGVPAPHALTEALAAIVEEDAHACT